MKLNMNLFKLLNIIPKAKVLNLFKIQEDMNNLINKEVN